MIVVGRNESFLEVDLHLDERRDGDGEAEGHLGLPEDAAKQAVKFARNATAQVGECFNGRSHDRLLWVICELRRRSAGRSSGRHPKGRNEEEHRVAVAAREPVRSLPAKRIRKTAQRSRS